jgi:hypothetical protein
LGADNAAALGTPAASCPDPKFASHQVASVALIRKFAPKQPRIQANFRTAALAPGATAANRDAGLHLGPGIAIETFDNTCIPPNAAVQRLS